MSEAKFPHVEALGLEVKSNGKVFDTCGRCGGKGHLGAGIQTGFQPVVAWGTCFECGGTGGWWKDAAVLEKKLKRRAQAAARRAKKAAEKAAQKAAETAAKKAEFFAANPGIEDALRTDHPIVKDMVEKLESWGSLTENQVKLVHKLAKEAAEPEPEKVPVEAGRRTMTGTVVSQKLHHFHIAGRTQTTEKMLVVLDTGEKVWGSVPRTVKTMSGDEFETADWSDRTWDEDPKWLLKGHTIRFTATVEVKDDKFFGFFKRPTNCRVLEQAA